MSTTTSRPTPDEDTPGARVLEFRRAEAISESGSPTLESSGNTSDVVGPVIDAELVDDDPTAGPVLVDGPADQAGRPGSSRLAGQRSGTRRPIVAPWLRSRSELGSTLRWAVGHVAHTVAFHAVRVPLYAARLAARSPPGRRLVPGRVVVGVWRWVFDAEGAPLRVGTVGRGDADGYLKLVHVREDRVRFRSRVALLALVVMAIAELRAIEESPWGGDGDSRALDARRLARELARFSVRPVVFKDDANNTARGYVTYATDRQVGLVDAWDRYLPPDPDADSVRNQRNHAGQTVTDELPVTDACVTTPLDSADQGQP